MPIKHHRHITPMLRYRVTHTPLRAGITPVSNNKITTSNNNKYALGSQIVQIASGGITATTAMMVPIIRALVQTQLSANSTFNKHAANTEVAQVWACVGYAVC